MPANRELKRRIRSARSISKITRAMEAVSGSKMLKAQERAYRGDSYNELLQSMITHIRENTEKYFTHPLLKAPNPETPELIIIVSSDRGLAGAFNTNLFRKIEKHDNQDLSVVTIGKKAKLYTKKTNWNALGVVEMISDNPDQRAIKPAVDIALEEYLAGRVSAVSIAYQKHINTLQSIPTIEQILPIPESKLGTETSSLDKTTLFEPSAHELLEELLHYSITVSLYQAVLSSKAAEQSARMVAMRNASKNAKSLGSGLQRIYNREYQKQITSEISDVVTAKMALQ